MQSQYLGQLTYEAAVQAQKLGWVTGFESFPVVTLGLRARPLDLLRPEEFWEKEGFQVVHSDRGGQATIHNPGQLVIFPTLDVRPWGARQFVGHLIQATQNFLSRKGIESRCRSGEPGLFTAKGKIMSVGLRVKNGIVHHGLAINVANDLRPFAFIRVCGRESAALDRLVEYGVTDPLADLFSDWVQAFMAEVARQPQLTKSAFSPNLCTDARS